MNICAKLTAFIDTCVIIDVLQNREPFSTSAVLIRAGAVVEIRRFRLQQMSVTICFYINR